jgi:hypothetical protein
MEAPAGGYGVLPPVPTILCLGLPGPNDNPPGPENSALWYDEAMKLPDTRVAGYFGATLGSHTAGSDVQLFLYEKDRLHPTVKLVVDHEVLFQIFAALGNLFHTRLGRLKEWSLTPIPPEPQPEPPAQLPNGEDNAGVNPNP